MQDTACAIWYPSDAPGGVLVMAGDGYTVGYDMQMTTTKDLKAFTALQSLAPSYGSGPWTPGTPGNTGTSNASPSIFINAGDNSLHMLWQAAPCLPAPCMNPGSTLGNNNLQESHPTVQTLAGLTGMWSQPVQLNASGTYIDPNMIQVGSNYCLFAKENTGYTIESACSASLTGPFSLAAIASFTTAHCEKPSLVQLDGGTIRMYLDYECGSQPYSYRDSTDGGSTWGDSSDVVQPTGVNSYGQGTVLGCAPGSYYMRAGQFQPTTDPNWMRILRPQTRIR